MIDCSRVTRLTATQRERGLPLWQRMQLAIHRIICAPCRAYYRQLGTISSAARRLDGKDQPAAGLAGDARERIRERLRQAQQD